MSCACFPLWGHTKPKNSKRGTTRAKSPPGPAQKHSAPLDSHSKHGSPQLAPLGACVQHPVADSSTETQSLSLPNACADYRHMPSSHVKEASTETTMDQKPQQKQQSRQSTCSSTMSGTDGPAEGPLQPKLRVDFEDLTFHELIGKGSSKTVYRGRWNSTMVAIVCMRRGGTVPEARIMQRLRTHPNLVHFYRWAVDDSGNEYIMLELVRMGSLDKLLFVQGPSFRTRDRLAICEQICGAMCELAEGGILHMDLAARNILVQSMDPVHVKVSDLGLARCVPHSTTTSMQELEACVPVRWTAPEVLLRGEWSQKSDVWSYGVTLWEIFTNGSEPYATKTDHEVMDRVVAGEVLPQPDGCPNELYALMLRCWRQDPAERPTFVEILQQHKQWRREHMLQALGSTQTSARIPRLVPSWQDLRSAPSSTPTNTLSNQPYSSQADLLQCLSSIHEAQHAQYAQHAHHSTPCSRHSSGGSSSSSSGSIQELPRPSAPNSPLALPHAQPHARLSDYACLARLQFAAPANTPPAHRVSAQDTQGSHTAPSQNRTARPISAQARAPQHSTTKPSPSSSSPYMRLADAIRTNTKQPSSAPCTAHLPPQQKSPHPSACNTSVRGTPHTSTNHPPSAPCTTHLPSRQQLQSPHPSSQESLCMDVVQQGPPCTVNLPAPQDTQTAPPTLPNPLHAPPAQQQQQQQQQAQPASPLLPAGALRPSLSYSLPAPGPRSLTLPPFMMMGSPTSACGEGAHLMERSGSRRGAEGRSSSSSSGGCVVDPSMVSLVQPVVEQQQQQQQIDAIVAPSHTQQQQQQQQQQRRSDAVVAPSRTQQQQQQQQQHGSASAPMPCCASPSTMHPMHTAEHTPTHGTTTITATTTTNTTNNKNTTINNTTSNNSNSNSNRGPATAPLPTPGAAAPLTHTHHLPPPSQPPLSQQPSLTPLSNTPQTTSAPLQPRLSAFSAASQTGFPSRCPSSQGDSGPLPTPCDTPHPHTTHEHCQRSCFQDMNPGPPCSHDLPFHATSLHHTSPHPHGTIPPPTHTTTTTTTPAHTHGYTPVQHGSKFPHVHLDAHVLMSKDSPSSQHVCPEQWAIQAQPGPVCGNSDSPLLSSQPDVARSGSHGVQSECGVLGHFHGTQGSPSDVPRSSSHGLQSGSGVLGHYHSSQGGPPDVLHSGSQSTQGGSGVLAPRLSRLNMHRDKGTWAKPPQPSQVQPCMSYDLESCLEPTMSASTTVTEHLLPTNAPGTPSTLNGDTHRHRSHDHFECSQSCQASTGTRAGNSTLLRAVSNSLNRGHSCAPSTRDVLAGLHGLDQLSEHAGAAPHSNSKGDALAIQRGHAHPSACCVGRTLGDAGTLHAHHECATGAAEELCGCDESASALCETGTVGAPPAASCNTSLRLRREQQHDLSVPHGAQKVLSE